MSVKTYSKGEQKQLSKNFKLSEFHCHCNRSDCKTTRIDDELLDRLQYMRDRADINVNINSGYRCAKHNASKAVGGSKTSKHPMGQAADIVVKGMKASDMAKLAVEAGFRGVILYNNRVHVDTRQTDTFYHRDYNNGRYSKPAKSSWGASAVVNPWVEPTETVKKGSKGLTVKWVQWALKRAGIKLDKIDGSFGPATDKAVRKFQTDKQLEVDGRVGPATRAALKSIIN